MCVDRKAVNHTTIALAESITQIDENNTFEPCASFHPVSFRVPKASDEMYLPAESLHHSRPCFSFLPLWSPKSLRRIAPRQSGTGYVYLSWFRQYAVIWPMSDLMTLCPDIQLLRPKPVHGRSIHDGVMQWDVSFSDFACRDLRSHIFAAYIISPLFLGYYCPGPTSTKEDNLCVEIPSCIPSSAHVMHTREGNGLRTITLGPLLYPRRLMYLSLVGRSIQPTAQRPYIPLCQFPVTSENL